MPDLPLIRGRPSLPLSKNTKGEMKMFNWFSKESEKKEKKTVCVRCKTSDDCGYEVRPEGDICLRCIYEEEERRKYGY